MAARDILIETMEYLAPAKLLDGLTAEQAAARVGGAPHTIVEILAHIEFWQGWFVACCNGAGGPVAAHAAEGWPAAGAGDWERLRASFLSGLDQAVALEPRSSELISPAIEFPPLANYRIGDAITHIAIHNAHHLGQIATLRQMQGTWPPPAGSWTW